VHSINKKTSTLSNSTLIRNRNPNFRNKALIKIGLPRREQYLVTRKTTQLPSLRGGAMVKKEIGQKIRTQKKQNQILERKKDLAWA